jgi:hypothetical protein
VSGQAVVSSPGDVLGHAAASHTLRAVRVALTHLRLWPARRWALATVAAAVSAAVIGIPTDLIDTPLFGRTIPVTVWAYPVWIVSSLLAGLLVATEIRPGRPLAGGGALALVAVACPVCNKPAVLLLGTGGAVSVLGPFQPALGGIAIVLLGVAVGVRLRAQASCPAPSGSAENPA